MIYKYKKAGGVVSFKKEYLAEWVGNDKNYEAYKLYVKYEYECEEYDRGICTIFDEDGFAMPISIDERKLSHSNAISKLDHLQVEKKRWGISHDDWLDARKQVRRLSFQGLKDEYKRLFLE